MRLKLEFLVTAAAAAALAMPAAAQDAAVDADARAEIQTGAGVEVDTGADLQAEVDTGAETEAAGRGGPDAEADANAEAEAAGAGEIVVATPADLQTGVAVLDPQGGMVGTVEQVDADGAIVSTGNVRAKMPLESFGKNDRGLVISMTRAEFEAAVAARNPS